MSLDQRRISQSGRKAVHVLALLSMLLTNGVGTAVVKVAGSGDPATRVSAQNPTKAVTNLLNSATRQPG
jgi:hypothetical protein